MTLENLAWIDSELSKVIDTPQQLEAERNVLLNYFSNPSEKQTPYLQLGLETILEKRVQDRLPLAYILGETRFYGLKFFVTAQDDMQHTDIYRTYSPRIETEILVDRALAYCRKNHVASIVDIATGSGCIPISVKKNYPQAAVTAIDISEAALAVAKRNATENNTDIRFLQGSWLEPIQGEQFDLILCNPPYAPIDQQSALTPEAFHEPHQALFPDETPVELYKRLLTGIKSCLNPKGAFILEIGFGQFNPDNFDVVQFAAEVGLSAHIEKDHTGTDRFLLGHHNLSQ